MGTLLTATAHGLVADDTVMLANLVGGAGLAENTLYYVLAAGLTADDFAVSLEPAGAAVAFTTSVVSGSVVRSDVYTATDDGAMSPPEALEPPTSLSLTSDTYVSANGMQALRLIVSITQPSGSILRSSYVELTRVTDELDAPVWTDTTIVPLPIGSTSASVESVVGGTRYWGRAWSEDVYGNLSGRSDVVGPHTVSAAEVASGVNIINNASFALQPLASSVTVEHTWTLAADWNASRDGSDTNVTTGAGALTQTATTY